VLRGAAAAPDRAIGDRKGQSVADAGAGAAKAEIATDDLLSGSNSCAEGSETAVTTVMTNAAAIIVAGGVEVTTVLAKKNGVSA
jgi:predicted RNA methylase